MWPIFLAILFIQFKKGILKGLQMDEQYKELGKSLLSFYITRLIGIGVIYFIIMGYINDFFLQTTNQFPDQSSIMQYDRMVNILQTSKSTIKTIAKMTQTVIKQNNSIQDVKYCQSNQTYDECYDSILNTLDSQLIYSRYGILISFTCVFGTCSQVAILWDYYWAFKIRLPFINYLLIQYDVNATGKQKLIVPACSNLSAQLNSIYSVSPWILYHKNGLFYLSMNQKVQGISLRVTLVFDTSILKRDYSIQLSNYQISPSIIKPNFDLITYQIEGVQLFGYLPLKSNLALRKWVYNLLIILGIVVFSLPIFFVIKMLIAKWQSNLFKHLEPLKSLYTYQINSIFGGQKPKKSVILSETTFTYFFQDLSEILQKDCEPLRFTTRVAEKEDSFKFTQLIDQVMAKFQESLKPLEEQRTRQLTNLKPLIRSSINDISQSVRQKMRDLFIKSRQLLMLAQFFYFGYLSLLSSIQVYEQVIRSQRIPLPDPMINLFRYMNYTVNSTDLKFAFKFAFAYNHIIQQQIIMKLQDNLLQKYLASLKDLDVGDPTYATRLGLKKRLNNLQKCIENKKHMFSVYLK